MASQCSRHTVPLRKCRWKCAVLAVLAARHDHGINGGCVIKHVVDTLSRLMYSSGIVGLQFAFVFLHELLREVQADCSIVKF